MLKVTMLSLILILLHIHPCLNLCVEKERQALLEIEKDIHDPTNWFSSWKKGGDCCNWQGITCHNTTGHVVGLDLHHPFDLRINADAEAGSKLNPSLANLKHLIYLNLSYNYFFVSSFPAFIGSLTRLEYLDLSGSMFGGTIPPQLGNLSNLKVLNMDYMLGLQVDDLHWLSRLTSLTYLHMNSVDLSIVVHWFDDIIKLPYISTISLEECALSSIPATVPPLNNFTFLKTFHLGGNKLNSSIPGWLLNNVSSLERLTLNYCGLYGGLPLHPEQVSKLKVLNLAGNYLGEEVLLHLDRLPLLEKLDLAHNNIYASISKTLRNLTHLDLSANQIHGSLPKTLGNYNQLKTLRVSSNNITGEIPHSIGNLFRLTTLSLAYNNIGGRIPRSIGNLSKLSYLYLQCNNIEGKIPDSIGNLEKLIEFDVSTNHLSGEIPHSLFNLTNLYDLNLTNNHVGGELPKSINLNYLSFVDLSNNGLHGPVFFSNQSYLVILDLSNNSFTGTLPFSRGITSLLHVVNLSNNRFSGTIPNLFMFHTSLESLQLNNNKLNGVIPSSLKYCFDLRFLDLSENNLHGKIPPWIGTTLRSLRVLNLRSNNLVGQIPIELSYLTSLQILDLSHNHLSGNFSLYFGDFTMMNQAEKTRPEYFNVYIDIWYADDDWLGNQGDEHGYMENIWLNNKGIARQYTTTIEYTIFIDISSNEISGEISNGITKLDGLKILNLSRNHFVGNIPKDIGAIEDLESLDLSLNGLSGEIPSTMAKLSHLSTLNLSYNNLSGMVPKGSQFQTFADPSIYSGNSNLCGWPLPECFGSNNNNTNFGDKENEEREYWYEETWMNVGTVVGFLISSWGLFITLLINNSMRRLYFYYVDKLSALISLQFHICISKIKSKIMKTEMH